MNFEYDLILIKSEDKTEKVEHCRYADGQWEIIYSNSSKKYYYGYHNVLKLKVRGVMSPLTCVVYFENQPLSGITRILDFGDYIRLIFHTGYHRIYHRSSIVIEETCLVNKKSNDCFNYLKRLSDQVSIRTEEDISFLSKQYNRISVISPRSVLSMYLEKKPLKKQRDLIQPVFPFGFNLSQKAATEKAFTEQVSVIEGPPGTGKTQTILNIIANAIMNEKTIAMVSNNNSATANVLDKLKKYGVDFVAAYLGNSENKENFFAEQSGVYPNLSDWVLSHTNIQTTKQELTESHKKLNEMLEKRNKQAFLLTELSGLQTEHEYFSRYYKESYERPIQIRYMRRLGADKILELMIKYKQDIKKGDITVFSKLYNLLIFGIYSMKIYDYTPEEVIALLQKTYYERKAEELKERIDQLSTMLDKYNFEGEMKSFSDKSMILFKAKLAERYKHSESRPLFPNEAIWKDFGSFIKEYPVILSTTHSLRKCASENYLFDYVIIDEASQVDIVTGALALSCAKNAVIVGDLRQLPNVVPMETAIATRQIFETFDLDKAYSYADNSILASIVSLYQDIPKTLLREHYRCHPKIIGFCNQKFYKNELIILTHENENDKPMVLYKTAKGNHARGNLNQRQIDVIFEEIIPDQKIDPSAQSVGIISPYRLQANELKAVISGMNIEADTVHKFQGREKDIIILTTVANEITANDFVDDPNLVNVAVSRAVNKLIVVASEGCDVWKGTNIGDLVRYTVQQF